ncbi:MAG TPA: ELM1/GtrOC1 family putative glycosyltransferase [Dongiaceae bacterium]|nr:ELM1/GtrOC1 family putative glycosyltransferase [Dongiaceae bacterium]
MSSPSGLLVLQVNSIATTRPQIWALLTQALGDNDQCLALAEALDRPVAFKRLAWHVADTAEDRAITRALLADTPQAGQWREALGIHAPWPQMVICCGRRSDRIGFWIKRQSRGYTKVVSIGRARRPVAWYDLLVAPPQFSLPERSNVVSLSLPMARRRHMAGRSGTEGASPNGASVPVPKPWFTILLGGKVKQFAASEQRLIEAARRAQAAASRHGGSVVISTSRRTPSALIAAVERALDRPYVYRWSDPGAADNPYEVLLRDSGALFVTADSASMILDCCASGTPTYVIEYPERLDLRRRWRRNLFRHLRRAVARCRDWGLDRAGDRLDRVQDWLHARRILRYPRDLRRFHESVYGMGLARPADAFDPAILPRPHRPAGDLSEASGIREAAARALALSRPVAAE